MAETVLAYFDMRREAFLSALSAARTYYAVEGIHELRVEVKRLRALYKLVECLAPSFASTSQASSFKKLFRTAGELRDIDIHQAVTLQQLRKHDLREYFNHLKHDELLLREPFSEACRTFSKGTLTQGRVQIGSAFAAATDERLRKRMDKRITKLVDRLTAALDRKGQSNDDLHSVRKTAKELRYTLDVRQLCCGKSPVAEGASARLKSTYSCLGDWRDALLTLESVATFMEPRSGRHLADPVAYAAFQDDLGVQAKGLLATFERGRQSLRRALDRLSTDLRRNMTRPFVSAG